MSWDSTIHTHACSPLTCVAAGRVRESTRCRLGKESHMTLMCAFRCTVRVLFACTEYSVHAKPFRLVLSKQPHAQLTAVGSDQCAALEYCPVVCSHTRRITSTLPQPSSSWRELLRRQIPPVHLQIPRSMAYHSCPTWPTTHLPPGLLIRGDSTPSLNFSLTTTLGV